MNVAEPMLVILILFLLAAVSFAATQNLRMLTLANVTCLLCIPLLGGGPIISTGGSSMFTGATFFPVVMFGVTLQYLVYGSEAAYGLARYILFSLLLVFGSMFLLEHGGLLGPNYDADIRKIGVRFVCLCLAQSLLIYRLNRPSRIPDLLRIPLLTLATHIAEGCVFYPCILLGRMPTEEIVSCTIRGLTIRLMVVALSVPFLAVVLRARQRRPSWFMHGAMAHAAGQN